MQEGDIASADAMRCIGREHVNLYQIEDGYFHFSGALATNTGCIGKFDLKKHKNGFLLGYPNHEVGRENPPFDSAPQLSKMIEQYSLWEDVLFNQKRFRFKLSYSKRERIRYDFDAGGAA